MKWVYAFLKFLYDLVIGDCWQITVAIGIILAGGVFIIRLNIIPANLLALGLGAVIMLVPPLIVVLTVRAGMRVSNAKSKQEI